MIFSKGEQLRRLTENLANAEADLKEAQQAALELNEYEGSIATASTDVQELHRINLAQIAKMIAISERYIEYATSRIALLGGENDVQTKSSE